MHYGGVKGDRFPSRHPDRYPFPGERYPDQRYPSMNHFPYDERFPGHGNPYDRHPMRDRTPNYPFFDRYHPSNRYPMSPLGSTRYPPMNRPPIDNDYYAGGGHFDRYPSRDEPVDRYPTTDHRPVERYPEKDIYPVRDRYVLCVNLDT